MRSGSMNAVAHLQRGRVGAEPADRGFPHQAGIGVEDDIERHIGHEPGRLLELLIELAGAPSGIPGEHERAGRRDASRARAAAGVARSTRYSPSTIDAVILFRPARREVRIQPRSGSTGPPVQSGDRCRTRSAERGAPSWLRPRRSGRFSTRPNAPSGRKSQSRITVLAKFGSRSCGIETSSVGWKCVRHESILPRRTLPPPPSSNQPRTASSLPVSSRRLMPGGLTKDAPSR